jgi:hypothetical protein
MKKGFAILVVSLVIVAFSLGTAFAAFWVNKDYTVETVAYGSTHFKIELTNQADDSTVWLKVDPASTMKKEILAMALTAKVSGKTVRIEKDSGLITGLMVMD